MNKLYLSVLLILTVSIPAFAQTQLFTEDWSSGSISNDWNTVQATGGDLAVVDAGGGDFALQIQNQADLGGGGWGTLINLKQAFTRGNNVNMQFRVWNTVDPPPSNTGICGGWHHNPTVGATGHSLILGFWLPNFENWEQNGLGGSGSQVPSAQFAPDFSAAIDKASSIIVRITLGDSRGGRIEWSTDDGATFNTPGQWDTIGSGPSMDATNRIGWWGVTTAIFVDDIFVFEGVAGPTPTPQQAPTATPTPFALTLPLFDNFNSGVIDPAIWSEIDGQFNPSGDGDNIELANVGTTKGGSIDWAVSLENFEGLGAWNNILSTRGSASRGNNLEMSFKFWNDGVVPTGTAGCAGGWHHTPSTGATGHEYILGFWSPTWSNWEFNGLGGSGNQTPAPAFDDAFNLAVDKANAICVRVSLDNAAGGQIEYSTDGGNNFVSPGEWNELGSGNSTNPNNFVGFWCVDQEVFIDDVVIENDLFPFLGPPSGPTSTPFPSTGVGEWESYE